LFWGDNSVDSLRIAGSDSVLAERFGSGEDMAICRRFRLTTSQVLFSLSGDWFLDRSQPGSGVTNHTNSTGTDQQDQRQDGTQDSAWVSVQARTNKSIARFWVRADEAQESLS